MNKMNPDSELIAGILANIERVMSGQAQSIRRILAAMAEGQVSIEGRFPGDAAELRYLASLHYRYRFDPKGLSGMERNELSKRAAAWIKNDGLRAQVK